MSREPNPGDPLQRDPGYRAKHAPIYRLAQIPSRQDDEYGAGRPGNLPDDLNALSDGVCSLVAGLAIGAALGFAAGFLCCTLFFR